MIAPSFNPATVLLLGLSSGVLPIYFSYVLWGRLRASLARRFLPALSVGVLFWSLYDLLQETAGLGIGVTNPMTQILSLSLLGSALLASAYASTALPSRRVPYFLAYAWAVGLAFHSWGEGIVIGHDFSTGESILDFNQVTSFVLHKFGEGTTLFAILAWAKRRSIDLASTGLIAGAPLGVGALLGYSGVQGGLVVYLFSLATGSTIYILSFLISRLEIRSVGNTIFILLGLLLMYGAGLLHQLP